MDDDASNAAKLASPGATFTAEDYAGYLDALRAHDYAGFTRYYTPDVRMIVPGGPALDSEGLVNMERGLADIWDWTMDVRQIVLDEHGAAVRATMEGPFLKDVPEIFGASPKAGERWSLDFVMFYVLRDGKIAELHPSLPPSFTRRE